MACNHVHTCGNANSQSYTNEDLLNYRSLDFYVNFVSGFVREVLVKALGDNIVIAKVRNHCFPIVNFKTIH